MATEHVRSDYTQEQVDRLGEWVNEHFHEHPGTPYDALLLSALVDLAAIDAAADKADHLLQ